MIPNHSLPPELDTGAVGGYSAEELAEVWVQAANASPLVAMDPPDPARVYAIQKTLPRRPNLRLVGRPRYWAVAASALLLVATGIMLSSRPVQIMTAATAIDTELPDGSTVSLSPQSSLTYRRNFGRSHRTVSVAGSASFDVSNSDVSFVVQAPGMTITVLGTRFDVEADNEETAVSVSEGTVMVAVQGESHHLTAGEGLTVQANTGLVARLNIASPDEAGEGTELFIHIKKPLGVMFDAAAERFDVEIMSADYIRQHVHNFKHEVTTAEALVSDLCRSVTSMSLRYRSTATGFEILEE